MIAWGVEGRWKGCVLSYFDVGWIRVCVGNSGGGKILSRIFQSTVMGRFWKFFKTPRALLR